jgi:hypothetical protein
MADPDADSSDALQRAKQAQARSEELREQIVRAAKAIAETEDDVARLHRQFAAQGGLLAAG